MIRTIVTIAVFAALAAGSAPIAASQVEAFQNATVRPGGVVTGVGGLDVLVIAGSEHGASASYGVARFDVSAVRAEFDAYYGAGRWIVSAVTLLLTRTNPAFTADGRVSVHFTRDDTVALTAPTSLAYSGLDGPSFARDFSDAYFLASYEFRGLSSATVDDTSLYMLPITGAPPANPLADDIRNEGIVTLVLADGSAGVAANYAGVGNDTYDGPTLVILAAQVPEPEIWALLGAGLLLVGGVRGMRRRG